ncbi:ROK family protein [Nesterenkonia cremea]|uniref:NagC family transcriptional regulator n=1 Tax=Nesterenkonia cremea TaxID=1882340 RepID=A0A917AJZ2_9MICC|nr:ROK family protein [Nesterenkonia cremea]GGE58521.1 NagC family transcriptional regulator [Nesterenkonia cremea]
MSGGISVGLDLGGTKTDAVALDASGQVRGHLRLSTRPGTDGVLATIRQAMSQLQESTGDDLASIGVGIPGQISADGSEVRYAVNLGLSSLDLGGRLAREFSVPVRVENDVKAAARGVAALRGGSTETLAYLNLGTGVAAGIVVEGTLWRGAGGVAGEIGHLSIDPSGPECRCGQRGCIEAFAGGGSLARRWGAAAPSAVRGIITAAEDGDELAQRLRSDLAFGTAAAVRLLVLAADVPTVVLGGGVSHIGESLVHDVRSALRAAAESSQFLRSLELQDRVELLGAGSPAASLGAALVGMPEGRDEEAVVGVAAGPLREDDR